VQIREQNSLLEDCTILLIVLNNFSTPSHHLATFLVIFYLLGMWNSSPLMIATQYAQDEIANFLLNQDDIKIDHVNDNGVSTLLIACSGKYQSYNNTQLDVS
jgi:hypothetical protein